LKKIKNKDLGRKTVNEFQHSEKIPVVIVLDNVRSLNNVGSVFRTADAFLCKAVYLCGITGKPPHREIEKTALGATDTVTWKYFSNALDAAHELKEQGYVIAAVEQAEGGVFLDHFKIDSSKKYALVFGHEMFGVSDEVLELADAAIEVPQQGTKHSLNVAVCAGVVIWEFFRGFKKHG
jgi:23S rRNA (guanosine2251-2'-O)-methyltransferase